MLASIGAEVRPNQFCIGALKSFGELKQSKPDPENPNKVRYFYNELAIHGMYGAGDVKSRVFWLPDWFSPKFSTRSLTGGATFVFARTVQSMEETSILKGLCGDNETWIAFQQQLETLGDYTADSLDDFFRSFYRNAGPMPFMYELRQERKKSGVDENGKTIYVRGKYLEVAGFEHVNATTLKSLQKRLERNRKKIADAVEKGTEPPVLTIAKFSPADVGFDEIEFPADEVPSWVTA